MSFGYNEFSRQLYEKRFASSDSHPTMERKIFFIFFFNRLLLFKKKKKKEKKKRHTRS